MNISEEPLRTSLHHLVTGEVEPTDVNYLEDLGFAALNLTNRSMAVQQEVLRPAVLGSWPTYWNGPIEALRVQLPRDRLANELTVSIDGNTGQWVGSVGAALSPAIDLFSRYTNAEPDNIEVGEHNEIEAATYALFLHIQQLRQAG